jgi:hypothetical protein
MAPKKTPIRTAKGNVTAAIRKKAGNPDGSFPIASRDTALSALNLRGHSDNPARELNRVARWANKNDDTVVKQAVAKVREVEKDKK